MGDYGFKGAEEFGWLEEYFNCLPDYHFSKCPLRLDDGGGNYLCLLTGRMDPTDRSDLCNFCEDNYKECLRYKI